MTTSPAATPRRRKPAANSIRENICTILRVPGAPRDPGVPEGPVRGSGCGSRRRRTLTALRTPNRAHRNLGHLGNHGTLGNLVRAPILTSDIRSVQTRCDVAADAAKLLPESLPAHSGGARAR